MILGLAGDHCLNEALELYARVAEAVEAAEEIPAPPVLTDTPG
jgi:hypothetical protein